MKYKIIKYYKNNVIDEETMTIEELKEYAKQFIGDVFHNENDLEETIKYIEENGYDRWALKYQLEIEIEKVE